MTEILTTTEQTMACARCKFPIFISAVIRWPNALRFNWLVTGLCRECQGK